MLSYTTVEPKTLGLLKALMHERAFCDMRLVGGTALALQYGHRQSVDLDFFGDLSCDVADTLPVLSGYGQVGVLKETQNIRIYTIDGVKVDFVHYSCYQWIDDAVLENGIRLASTKDIAAMKINAIEGRGTRKDFVDVFFLLKHYSLQEILSFYKAKYPNYSDFRALMSLTYFEDAEMQPMPKMIDKTPWEEMRRTILKAVERL